MPKQLPALTTEHILFLIPLQHAVNKVLNISANKLRIFMQLKEYGLVQEDDDGYGVITDEGNLALQGVVNEFNRIAVILKVGN